MSAPKRSTEIRRDEIARAALEIIAARGMKGLRVGAVASRVGLVPSGIYRHYRSKDELIDAVLDYIQSRFSANARAAARMEGDAGTRLHALLMKHVDLICESGSIPQVVFSQEVYAGHPRRRTKLLGVIQGYLAEIAGMVEAGQREGTLRGDLAPAAVALMFLGLIQPSAILWHLSAGRFDVRKQAEAAWPILHRAIRVGKTRRQRGGKGNGMKATEILKREHQAILRVIDAAEKEVAFIEKTGGTHAQTVREMADFFGNFRVESEEMGEGVHERYHAWIEKRVGAQAGARQDRTGVPVK